MELCSHGVVAQSLMSETGPTQLQIEAVLTSTHNLCFGTKIIKLDKPLPTPFFFFFIKVGYKEVFIART